MTSSMQRARDEVYWRGMFWILRHRASHNGRWPPSDTSKVCGWAVVRMLSTMTDRPPRHIAKDIIATAAAMDGKNDEIDRPAC